MNNSIKTNPVSDNKSAEQDAKKKKCFIIMPIADNPEYDAGHFDRVYDFLIKPACIQAGYQPIRADENKASNMIMLDVLRNIIDCDMAICDLSSRNANVFYELGLRQAFDKKTILIRDGKHDVPFDLLGFRYVTYSPTLRVDTVKKEINDIAGMLNETENADRHNANSIVSILKMQPAEIDPTKLNTQESLLFEVLGRINSFENTVKNLSGPQTYNGRLIKRNERGDKIWDEYWNENKHIIPEEVLASLRTNRKDDGLTFEHLDKPNNDILDKVLFTYNDEIIGFFIGRNEKGFLNFKLNNKITKIPDTFENRSSIYH